MYLKHHLFEHNYWRGPSKLWGTPLQIEDEQTKDDKNVAAGHLRGLEGWQTERLFQPTFCYKSLWQCPFLVWFWLYIFFLISDDLQQHYLMIYAPKSWSHLKLIFGEGLPISWSEEVLWRMKVRRRRKMTRMILLQVSSIKTLSVWQGQNLSHIFSGNLGCISRVLMSAQHLSSDSTLCSFKDDSLGVRIGPMQIPHLRFSKPIVGDVCTTRSSCNWRLGGVEKACLPMHGF